jgi:negative regulator of replication initiation
MKTILRSIVVLILTFASLVGCDFESRTIVDANPARVEHMKQALRDLWVGHIFWVRHVVSNIATNDPEERDAAEKEVEANTKQIADTIATFYGEAASDKLYRLLDLNIAAVREYSEATVAGEREQQDVALAHLASNADEIADFLSHLNPYLQKDTVRGLIATHGAHHILQINQYKAKDYAHVGATWPMMRRHVYVIADTLTTALAKQFPSKFS